MTSAGFPGQLFPFLHFENWDGGVGGVGKKFVFNYLTGVGQTLLLGLFWGFFFPAFFLLFPKRGENELRKGSWWGVGGRRFSGASGAALMKPALEGPFAKVLGGGPPSRPSPSQNAVEFE